MKARDVAEFLGVIEDYHEKGLTDGLPVVPPERALVEELVAASGLAGDSILGVMPPRYTEVTVRDVATNAVMAGCLPEHFPVVLAAMSVVLHPDFNPLGVATTTKGMAPLTIVNGPIRTALGINARGNLFGPGPRSNAVIGRAVRLCMLNLGGAAPRILDKTTIGHPGKYTLVIGEDEEASPWEPLHVAHGYAPGDDVVTVIPVEGATQIMTHQVSRPETVLDTFVDSMNVASHYTAGGPAECLVILAPEHRAIFQRDGWSRSDIQRYLVEACWKSAGELWRYERVARGFAEGDPAESRVPLFHDPDEIMLVAAGGPGVSSTFCWGYADHRFLGHSGHARIGAAVPTTAPAN